MSEYVIISFRKQLCGNKEYLSSAGNCYSCCALASGATLGIIYSSSLKYAVPGSARPECIRETSATGHGRMQRGITFVSIGPFGFLEKEWL